MLPLLHQEEQIDKVEKLVREAGEFELTVFDHLDLPDLDSGVTVLAYLQDGAIAQLLPKSAKHGWRVVLLPHPDGRTTRAAFGVDSSLSDGRDFGHRQRGARGAYRPAGVQRADGACLRHRPPSRARSGRPRVGSCLRCCRSPWA